MHMYRYGHIVVSIKLAIVSCSAYEGILVVYNTDTVSLFRATFV
jgi:hypothetical protein